MRELVDIRVNSFFFNEMTCSATRPAISSDVGNTFYSTRTICCEIIGSLKSKQKTLYYGANGVLALHIFLASDVTRSVTVHEEHSGTHIWEQVTLLA